MDASLGVLIFGAFIEAAEILVMVMRNKGWGEGNKQMVGLNPIIIFGLFTCIRWLFSESYYSNIWVFGCDSRPFALTFSSLLAGVRLQLKYA